MLPIMLATKALPEMEADRADLLAAHVASSGAKPIPDQFQSLTVRRFPAKFPLHAFVKEICQSYSLRLMKRIPINGQSDHTYD